MNNRAKTIVITYSLLALGQVLFALLVKSNIGIGVLSLVQIMLFSVFFLLNVRSLLRFDYIFIAFLFILHFPQYIVTGFNLPIDLIPGWNMVNLVPYDVYVESGRYSLLVSQATMLGLAVARYKLPTSKQLWQKNGWFKLPTVDVSTAKSIALTLIVLGVLPSLYLDLRRTFLYFQKGYIATYDFTGADSGILNYVASLWKYGVVFLIVVYRSKPKKAALIAAFAVVYLMSTMLSGHRIMALMYIVTIGVVFFVSTINGRVRRSTVIVVNIMSMIAAYAVLVLVNYMNAARSGEEIGILRLATSPISYTIKALSNTISTVCYSILLFPQNSTIGYGLSYVTGWLTILPNIGGFLGEFASYNVFTLNIPFPHVLSLGGSYIAELYFNFRYFGILAAVVFGFVVGLLSVTIERDIVEARYVRAFMLLSSVPYVLQWPRAYFSEICRPLVWTSLLIIIIAKISESRSQQHHYGQGDTKIKIDDDPNR